MKTEEIKQLFKDFESAASENLAAALAKFHYKRVCSTWNEKKRENRNNG